MNSRLPIGILLIVLIGVAALLFVSKRADDEARRARRAAMVAMALEASKREQEVAMPEAATGFVPATPEPRDEVTPVEEPSPPPPEEQPRDALTVLLESLAEFAADPDFAKDGRCVAIVDDLMAMQAMGLSDLGQFRVLSALAAILNRDALRPAARSSLYNAIAQALGSHGEGGAKALKKAFENKSRFQAKPMWLPLRARLLRGIGRTKVEAHIKFLIDEARRNPAASLQAAAGGALGFYDQSECTHRKTIVGQLLITFGELSERSVSANGSIDPQAAKERLDAIRGDWVATLRKLTGQNFDTFQAWQAWFQRNKNKTW